MNLVFDFGAVVFDWRPVQLIQSQFADQASTPAQAEALARDIFHHADWLAFDRGTLALDEVIRRTSDRLGLAAHKLDAMLSPVGERMHPMEGTVALLAQLRERRERTGDLRLYYLSNMPEPYARQLEERHDFLQWFDGGIFSGDVKLIKPEPRIYQLLAERHALAPERTVFIDDTHGHVEAARAHGWHGIRFESPQALTQQLFRDFLA